MEFDVVIRQAGGRLGVLRVDAMDAMEARAQAATGGVEVMVCRPALGRRGAKAEARPARRWGRGNLDVAVFCEELAALLQAGLGMLEALDALADRNPSATQRSQISGVAERVRQGLPLSEAMGRQAGVFPPLLLATVGASERTGDLPEALARFAEHQHRLRSLRDKVVGAAIYPLLLLLVGGLVVLFLLTFVVPRFAVLLESSRASLPWGSALLFRWGGFVAERPEWAFGSLVLVFALAAWGIAQLRTGAGRNWMERLPVVGQVVRRFRHAQLYRTTSTLVRGGIPAVQAFSLGTSMLGREDAQRLVQAVAWLKEGRSISDALGSARLADEVAIRMLGVAERTGALADILERIAQFHEARLQRAIELVSRLFEPILMVAIGLVIGLVVVLMYLPIFDLASTFQ